MSKYYKKGSQIALDDTNQTRRYTDSQSNKRNVTEMVADKVYFCGSKPEQHNAPKNDSYDVKFAPDDFEEIPTGEDLPF